MDEVDIAQEITERNLNRALALRKVKPGVGAKICIECGKRIPAARRKAAPGCERCIQCQSEFEMR